MLRTPLLILRRTYELARPFGRKKLVLIFGVILFQGAMQVAGVASVFPFLAIAADPVAFRASRLGSMALGYFPPLTDAQLLTLAGAFSIALLFVANASSSSPSFL
jgi:hypothetical protein